MKDLAQVVDFRFVQEHCQDFYVDWGRDHWDPVLMFKMVFLQFLYDLSDQEMEEKAAFNLVYKWFLGLSTEELPPDHTVLCRFRQRLGPEGFETLFNQVVEQARNRDFITDRLHIIDSTHIIARVDLFRLKKEHKDKGDDDGHYVDRHSPDPDARFGRKSKKKSFYGYKAHKVEDADSEFIVRVKTTPGNVPDGTQLPALIDGRAGEATGDKAYDSEPNHAHLAAEGVTSGIIRRQRRPGRPRHSLRERPKIERKFSEGKNRHGLNKARYWGLAKVSIQSFMVAMVLNLKRPVKLTLAGGTVPQPA
ncbi:MAG: IS5 family transposase [Desulfobaccales bacterium]